MILLTVLMVVCCSAGGGQDAAAGAGAGRHARASCRPRGAALSHSLLLLLLDASGTILTRGIEWQCAYYAFSNGLMDTMLPKDVLLRQCKCSADQLCSAAPSSKLPRGQTWRTMTQIARIEGPLALYAGLPPTLLIAIPSTAMYFTSYEALYAELRLTFPDHQQSHSGVFAMAAGALARTASATVFSPLELIRVQMQAVANAEPFGNYVARAWRGGRRRLFAGLGATLARDVPFSAVYWWGIESTKAALLPLVSSSEHDTSARVAVAFASGVLAGMLATVVTHPFDVVKTRAQLASYPPASSTGPLSASSSSPARAPSFVELLQRVAKKEGVGGLTAGLVPRVAKVAPACAIMISSYEAAKLAFSIE